MSIWKDRLADIDDDYLIGLSNKGIVKRAYKDKGEVAAAVQDMGEDASVKVGEETVTVRYPLAESKCTCPSRSMCRHVVQAILVLREKCMAEEAEGNGSTEEASPAGTQEQQAGQNGQSCECAQPEQNGQTDEHVQGQNSQACECAQPEQNGQTDERVQAGQNSQACECVQSGQNSQTAGSMPPAGQSGQDGSAQSGHSREPVQGELSGQGERTGQERELSHGHEGGSGASPQIGRTEKHISPESSASDKAGAAEKTPVWKEISAYPFEKLKKALGVRQFQTFVNQVAAGIRPEIRSSSVITVQLPRRDHTVKLLSPLEYSTCSCHKKELCVHKASAILWCQLEAGTMTKQTLLGEIVETQEYDMAHVKEAAGQMKVFLEELFATGLSRTSPDVLDYLERLAIISHNEGLARFEGYFRALSDSYDRYFARKAAFKTEDLMEQMARLYRRVEMLLQAQDAGGVARLAGEFRADYIPVGNLDLIGIAMEHFESQTGYEGETIYFLEENTKKWYTYTNARPVFYDSRKRRGYTEKGQAPWGLNLTFENLLKVRIHLTGAKCDERNRLSSSQETRGEVTGEQGLSLSDIKDWYYRDFDNLFSGQIGKQQKAWLMEQDDAGNAGGQENAGDEGNGADGVSGNGVELVFVQPASCAKAEFSQTGQQLTLPLYDKAGREVLVEVVYSKQESGTIRYLERISERKLPCFIGKVYLKDGRVRMYPVDLMELEEDFGCDKTETKGQYAAGKRDGTGCTANETGSLGAGLDGRYGASLDSESEGRNKAQDAALSGRRSKYEVIEDLAAEIGSLMEDLYQSGFDTVHDSTLKDIQNTAKLTEQYGMAYLSELLSGMAEEISLSRHRMERKAASMAGLYTNVSEYLYLCRQKTAYDRGKSYYM
ncbi:MAG: hypothetical protein HFH84_09305 [Lachnospiraceae bacterium]|nr:hypothetical protein [Lachnospiraceae bacterium]